MVSRWHRDGDGVMAMVIAMGDGDGWMGDAVGCYVTGFT
jgi:hypothetical protein